MPKLTKPPTQGEDGVSLPESYEEKCKVFAHLLASVISLLEFDDEELLEELHEETQAILELVRVSLASSQMREEELDSLYHQVMASRSLIQQIFQQRKAPRGGKGTTTPPTGSTPPTNSGPQSRAFVLYKGPEGFVQ